MKVSSIPSNSGGILYIPHLLLLGCYLVLLNCYWTSKAIFSNPFGSNMVVTLLVLLLLKMMLLERI